MHSDPNPRRASKANGLQIFVAIVLAATVLSIGVSLDHRVRADGAAPATALAPSAATPAMAPSLPGSPGDPSLPAAAEALRGNGGAAGDDATTF